MSDDAVRATIVTGAGKVAFSAGADLGQLIPLFTGARKPEDEWDSKLLADRKLGDIALLRGYDMDKPVISAVNGFCIAGGMEFIQGTDLRVASENASFGLQEVKWAIIPAAGSLARLQRQIPYCKAMEILLTGNRIDAQEAWRLGTRQLRRAAGEADREGGRTWRRRSRRTDRWRCARSRKRCGERRGVRTKRRSRSKTKSRAR